MITKSQFRRLVTISRELGTSRGVCTSPLLGVDLVLEQEGLIETFVVMRGSHRFSYYRPTELGRTYLNHTVGFSK